MSQQSFADMEYANRKRKTKRDEFLGIMEEVIPFAVSTLHTLLIIAIIPH